jgi:hypothetical protein
MQACSTKSKECHPEKLCVCVCVCLLAWWRECVLRRLCCAVFCVVTVVVVNRLLPQDQIIIRHSLPLLHAKVRKNRAEKRRKKKKQEEIAKVRM